MTTLHRLLTWTVVIGTLVIGLASEASATLSYTCWNYGVSTGISDPSVPWFPAKSTVDFWTSTNSTFDPRTATGLSALDFDTGVRKALSVWNEQSGSSIRLRYRGTTSATSVACNTTLSPPVCAVVITGDSTGCIGGSSTANIALDSSHKYAFGTIQMQKRAGGSCNPVTWVNTPTGGTDLVAVLIHEIGHEIFAINHPNDATHNTDCTQFDPSGNVLLSVMQFAPNATGTLQNLRSLKNWDMEVSQLRYGPRSQYAEMLKTSMVSGTSWNSAYQVTGTAGSKPLFRMSSLTQGISKRLVGYVQGNTAAPFNGGNGYIYSFQYLSGENYLQGHVNTTSAIGRPVAAASRPYYYVSPLMLVAYEKLVSSGTIYSDDFGTICYRTSTDNGATFGTETCSASTTNSYGLGAAYDPYADTFVITYSKNDPIGFPIHNYEIAVLTVPAGSSPPAPKLTYLGISSPHAPAIACGSGASAECLLAYEAFDSGGNLQWVKISINPSTGVATHGSVGAQALNVDDTPGLAYDSDTLLYRLALGNKASAVYSYSMSSTSGTTWAGTGDIYNNGGDTTQISGAAMSTRYMNSLVTAKPYAWFLRYW